jgi:hypothetical protein
MQSHVSRINSFTLRAPLPDLSFALLLFSVVFCAACVINITRPTTVIIFVDNLCLILRYPPVFQLLKTDVERPATHDAK